MAMVLNITWEAKIMRLDLDGDTQRRNSADVRHHEDVFVELSVVLGQVWHG